MAKVTYESSVMDAIIKAAADARSAGKTWNEAFVSAKKAGFKGAASTLEKLVRAALRDGATNHKMGQPTGYKNSTKTAETTDVSTNAFSKTAQAVPAFSADVDAVPERAPETLESIQNRLPVLRDGTHYARPISLFEDSFQYLNAGEIVAWSRILGKEEAVCVTNSHSQYPRGADVLVDSTLNPPGSFLTVIHLDAKETSYAVGAQLPVQRRGDGTAFVAIREIGPAEMLVLSNMPVAV